MRLRVKLVSSYLLAMFLVVVGFSSAASAQNIVIPGQHQSQSNWCWAATTSTLAAFYNNGTIVNGTYQCQLANRYHGRNDCCVNANAAADVNQCNKGLWTGTALSGANIYASQIEGQMTNATFGRVVQEITARRPVVGVIGWQNTTLSHAIIVHGIGFGGLAGGQAINIFDPWYGNEVGFQEFNALNRYAADQGANGNWIHTYFTKPAATGLSLASPEPRNTTIYNKTNYTVFLSVQCDSSAWTNYSLPPNTFSNYNCHGANLLNVRFKKSWLNGCANLDQVYNASQGANHFQATNCGMDLYTGP